MASKPVERYIVSNLTHMSNIHGGEGRCFGAILFVRPHPAGNRQVWLGMANNHVEAARSNSRLLRVATEVPTRRSSNIVG
jgi:hypothetical protein